MSGFRTTLALTASLAVAVPAAAQNTAARASAEPTSSPVLVRPVPPQFAGSIRTLPPLDPAMSDFPGLVSSDPQRQAIEYSDGYYTRLTIHRIGSYAMLPLFATEYLLGKRLLDGGDVASWVRPAHGTVAGGIGILFGVNTVTGVWNLWEGRKEPEGRARRFLHSALMIAADAGFLYTASLAEGDDEFEHGGGGAIQSGNSSNRHRNAALASIGLSTAGTALMWFWKD